MVTPVGYLRRGGIVLLLIVLLFCTALTDTYKASRKSFWLDEICTISVASRKTLPAIWDALHTAADGNPPLFHYLEARANSVSSDEEIGYRLNSIAGVICLSLCLFLFVRSRLGDTCALIASIFPLLTSAGTLYAIEARPYGMLLGCSGLALLAWRYVDRFYGAAALAIVLALATSLHFYGVFAIIPFAAGEVVRWMRTRRFRLLPWMALVFGAVPLAICWPLLSILKSSYGTHFWAQPALSHIPAYYDELLLLGDGVGVSTAAVIGFGLILMFARSPRAPREPEGKISADEYATALMFLLLPIVGYAAAKIVHGGFTSRYTIASIVGMSAGVAYLADWTGKKGAILLLSFMLATLIFREGRYWIVEARVPASKPALQEDVLQTAAAANLPLVVWNGEYIPLAYYDRGRNPFLTLIDKASAIRFKYTDSLDVTVSAVSRLLHFDAQPYQLFATSHRRFLLLGQSGNSWDWLPDKLRSDGAALTPVVVHGNQVLFLVEFRRFSG